MLEASAVERSAVLEASVGERLRALRALLGLTQTELARMSGVKQSWISDVERADADPDEGRLREIAKVTGTPFQFFKVSPSTVPLDSLRFRKLASTSKTATKRVHAFYAESHRVAEDLLTFAKYPTPPLPYAPAEQTTIDDGEMEEYATATREALRLAPDAPIPHLTRALERAGVAIAPIVLPDTGTAEQTSTTGHFGVSYWAGLGSPALIGYFPGQQGDRDRFTLAHELGHFVLHTFRPKPADSEGEANRFAGALLLPLGRAEEDLGKHLRLNDYAHLKARWGMSIQAIIMRGHAVGVIDDTRKRSLFVQLSQRGWRTHEPVTVGQEEPLLLWTLLSRRFGSRPYIPAAEPLAIHPTVLRSIAPTPQRPPEQRPALRPIRRRVLNLQKP